jgi:hypothetical protein
MDEIREQLREGNYENVETDFIEYCINLVANINLPEEQEIVKDPMNRKIPSIFK